MASLQALRAFINERLTAVAGEISAAFQQTVVQCEEEVGRQQRLLEISRTPRVMLPGRASPQPHVGFEEASFTLKQEEHEAPYIKEEDFVEVAMSSGESDNSHDSMGDWTNQRLTVAAGEIFAMFEQSLVQYMKRIDRQHRQLEIIWKPQVKLHRTPTDESETNTPLKRKSYCADYKLLVVKYAAEHGNRAAGREFGVNEKLVRNWRKAEVFLATMKKTKRANRGLKARWPELEERVQGWVLEHRAAGRNLSTEQVRLHAVAVAKEMGIDNFAGGPSWCYRFMQRNHLSIRARKAACRQLPADFQEDKVDSFRLFIEALITEHKMSPDHIINMDEIPLTLDIPIGRRVSEKRQNALNVATTGREKSHFTVVLACCADGTKLPPMVIFQSSTMPQYQFPPTVAVAVNEKGWIDQDAMSLWLTQCYGKRPDGVCKTQKALLLMDATNAHVTPHVMEKIESCNSVAAIVPGRLNKLLQPLDISVNRRFKAAFRRLWEEWMTDGEQSFKATGRMRRTTFQQIVGWVEGAWSSVTSQTVLSAFAKAGITKTDAESDEEQEATLHLPPELSQLLVSDTEEEDFDGFSDAAEPGSLMKSLLVEFDEL